MKHTIKTSQRSGVIVTDQWGCGDEIFLTLFDTNPQSCMGTNLTDEQASALIFALESALEARQVRRDGAIQCAGDKLCSVPSACPTPTACGVPA